MLRVTAAVLRRDGLVLAARRIRPDWLAGKWEFPGGKIEAGESARECLRRELEEELGLSCRVGRHLMTTRHAYPQLELELQAYEVELLDGELHLTDHDQVCWLPPAQLPTLDFACADLPIVELVARDPPG